MPLLPSENLSIVRTGTVHVAGHCGKQFRVRNGDVVRSFTHACPSCGTQVQSAKASGRIQSKHKKPIMGKLVQQLSGYTEVSWARSKTDRSKAFGKP